MGGKKLVLFYRSGADQNRLPRFLQFLYFTRNRLVLPRLGLENKIFRVYAGNWLIRRHRDGVEAVYFVEFFRRSRGGARHAGELLIQTEIILERDRGKRAALLLHRDAFFGFYGLMQAVAPPSARLHAPGEFIH